ncbi:MAG: hypothetical protein ACUVWX_04700 [Kiritimatiellia bacterium]
MHSFFVTCVVLLLMCLLWACGPQVPRASVSGLETNGEEEAEFLLPRNVRELLVAGNTNEAVLAIAGLLATETNTGRRAHLFGLEQRLMLDAGRIEDAQNRLLGWIGKDDALVGATMGIIPAELSRRNQQEALDKWLEKLIASNLPPGLLGRVYNWRAFVLAERNDIPRLLELLPETMARLGGEMSRTIWGEPFEVLLAKRNLDGLEELLTGLSQWTGERPTVETLRMIYSIRLLLARGQFAEAEKKIREAFEKVAETDANELARQFLDLTVRNGMLDEADRMAEFVISKRGMETSGGRIAVRAWLDTAQKRGGLALTGRLEELEKRGLATDTLQAYYVARFFDALKPDAAATAPRLIALGRRLILNLQDTNRLDEVRALIMDAAVLTDDYETALGVLGEGYRAADTNWRQMAENKLRAHLALKQGNKQEAVERFRSFMRYIEQHGESTTDPVSGLTYTKGMTLARNALRIAEILASMNDVAGAEAARREARSYYEKALTNLVPNSAESKFVREELQKLSEPARRETQQKETRQ